MKRTFLLLIALISLCLAMAAPVSAANSDLVTDLAGVLTDGERAELNDRAAEISEQYQCEVIVFIDEEMGGDTARECAEQVYLYNNYGYGGDKSGVMFYMSMAERDYSLIAFGFGNVAFTDYGKDVMLDNNMLPLLGQDEYYKAFSVYLDKSAEYLKMARDGEAFDDSGKNGGLTQEGNDGINNGGNYKSLGVGELLISIIIGLVVALVVCLIFRAQMKTAKKQRAAANYIPEGGFVLTGSSDTYLYSTESRRAIQNDDRSSGGAGGGTSINSGGFSGRSGKF